MPHPILSALLDAAALQDFLRSWPARCIHQHGPRARLPALFNSPQLASIDSLTRSFRGELMECDSRIDSRMKPVYGEGSDAVLERGATAVLMDVAPVLEGAGDFIAQLEAELGIAEGSIRLGAFASAAGNGARCHYDVYDVISVQLIGTKFFNVSPVKELRYPYGYQYNPDMPPFEDLFPQIENGFPDPADQDFEQIHMRPGSVLCMPRGTWHYTEADSDSLAISIVLSPPTELDRLVNQLSTTLLQNEAWRRPCYQLRDERRVDYATLPAIINGLIEREKNPHVPSKCFTAESRYIRDPAVQVETRSTGPHFEITLKGNPACPRPVTARLQVPEQTVAVFDWLLAQSGPFSVQGAMQAFPSLSLGYFQQIFQVASQAGLTHHLWFDPIE